jgi:hypothetical protein
MSNMVEAIGGAIIGGIRKALAPRDLRLSALEARVAAVEAKGLKYVGTWETNKMYHLGDATTAQGSLWICREAHFASQPDINHTYFQLAVKKGRDRKDTR